jgi:hypothetical protein
MTVQRKCIDGPLVGQVFNLDENRASGFIHKRNGTGRYLPVGKDTFKFEHWRKCTDAEVKEIENELAKQFAVPTGSTAQ